MPEHLFFYWVVRQSEVDSYQWFVQVPCVAGAEIDCLID